MNKILTYKIMVLTKCMDYSSMIDGRNILITGGTGSFGRQLVKEISNLAPKKSCNIQQG